MKGFPGHRFAYALPDLLAEYPDAKVILGTRSRAPWLRSYRGYIATSHLYHWRRQICRLFAARLSRLLGLGPVFRAAGLVDASGSGYDLEKLPLLMSVWSGIDRVVYGDTHPSPLWPAAMDRHNNAVRHLVPPENLLEFSIERGDGWREILDFLDVPEPHFSEKAESPLPWLNCVPGETCVSHISKRVTRVHARLTYAVAVAAVAAAAAAFHAFHAAF